METKTEVPKNEIETVKTLVGICSECSGQVAQIQEFIEDELGEFTICIYTYYICTTCYVEYELGEFNTGN